jgi:hypothetical protein
VPFPASTAKGAFGDSFMALRDASDDRSRKKSSESDSKSNVAVKGNSVGRGEGATDSVSNTITNPLESDRPQLSPKES